jgi:ribosomal protein S18 acetylase RimI-like enzyme
MIRPTEPEDIPALLEVAVGTGVFRPIEIVALEEVLEDYFEEGHALGHRSATYEQKGRAIGFVYYAPASMTDRAWYLYWIAIDKNVQARGIGGALLRHAEDDIHKSHGRLILIETSSLPHYDLTRRFYLKHGYEQDCTLHDFYADGDDMVVFRKLIHT